MFKCHKCKFVGISRDDEKNISICFLTNVFFNNNFVTYGKSNINLEKETCE